MKKFSTKQKLIYSIIAFFTLIIVYFSKFTFVRGINFSKIQSANHLSNQQQNELELLLQNEYSHKNTILTKLPYKLAPVELDVGAESAILINTSNGNILYEKNADKIIVLQNGEITDVGNSKELLKYDNWYKVQYLKQLKGDVYE